MDRPVDDTFLRQLHQLHEHVQGLAETIGIEIMRNPLVPTATPAAEATRRHLSYDAALVAAVGTLTMAVTALGLMVNDVVARLDQQVRNVDGRLCDLEGV